MNTPLKDRPRAVADLGEGSVLAVVEIGATPERIFQALSSTEIIAWWGSPDSYQTTAWSGDVRVGGHWRSDCVKVDGERFSLSGKYREVAQPGKLVQTWVAPWDDNYTTILSYRLDAIPGGTRLTVRHTGFAGRTEACAGHAEGWERALGWLVAYVDPAAASKAYFVCRLIPPRPDFVATMSPEEMAMMQEHAKYWAAKMREGMALVFGPVLDPHGPWGVGIVRAANVQAVEALRDGDPVITSGRGFRYEILPMMRAVVA